MVDVLSASVNDPPRHRSVTPNVDSSDRASGAGVSPPTSVRKLVFDRTARVRIRDYLRRHGPVEDRSGLATAALKAAVDYRGTTGSFIQLLAEMEIHSEIYREKRGRRTFRIGVLPADEEAGGYSALHAVDYDKLARAIVCELLAVAVGRAECDQNT